MAIGTWCVPYQWSNVARSAAFTTCDRTMRYALSACMLDSPGSPATAWRPIVRRHGAMSFSTRGTLQLRVEQLQRDAEIRSIRLELAKVDPARDLDECLVRRGRDAARAALLDHQAIDQVDLAEPSL